MLWRTHFGTGLLFGLTADLALAAAGHPLPVMQAVGLGSETVVLPVGPAVTLPILSGYFSAIPDVDHHSAKIRYAVPPARWLYLLVRLVVRLCGGEVDYWLGHRRITHTIDFAVWLGLAAALPVWWFGLWWWLPAAVTLGCWAHRLGDRLTDRGVPAWSWRLDARHRWIVDTDSIGEGAFAVVQGAVCVGLCWALLGAPALGSWG